MAIRINGTTVIDDSKNITVNNIKTLANGYFGILNPPTAFGSVSGFSSGGDLGGNSPGKVIDKFPFSTDANATSVGNLTQGRQGTAGSSSSTHGYSSGGFYYGVTRGLDKFSMVSDGNATYIGALQSGSWNKVGHQSYTDGYTSFGRDGGGYFATIEKHPFSADTTTTTVRTHDEGLVSPAGQSSTTHGYITAAKDNTSPFDSRDRIYKFSFATDSALSITGNLTVGRYGSQMGQSSTTSGYTAGGSLGPARYNIIDKFPFASDANATDVGDLTAARTSGAGQSSTTSGYVTGGGNPAVTNSIEKFPFATDSNATDIADLTVARFGLAGHQI